MYLVLMKRNIAGLTCVIGKYVWSDGYGCGVRLVCSSTAVVTPLPSCRKTTLTGPTPQTHQIVRTPLPYEAPSAPFCVICERIFAANAGRENAGTLTRSSP